MEQSICVYLILELHKAAVSEYASVCESMQAKLIVCVLLSCSRSVLYIMEQFCLLY